MRVRLAAQPEPPTRTNGAHPSRLRPTHDQSRGLGTSSRAATTRRLYVDCRTVVTIDSPSGDLEVLTSACAQTLDALRAQRPVVYQTAVQDKNLRGFADVIALNDDDEYVAQDTKLTRTAKVSALLQIADTQTSSPHRGSRSQTTELSNTL